MGRKKVKQKAAHARQIAPESGTNAGSMAQVSRRGGPRLTGMVPVRFEPAVLEEVRRRAEEDGRSVSAWIRRAVDAELRRSGGTATP